MTMTTEDPEEILIFSDTHFGVRSNDQIFQDIQVDYFKKFLIPLIQSRPNLRHCFLLGDLFETRKSLNVKTIHLALQQLKTLLGETSPTYHLVLGNHDIYYDSSREVHSYVVIPPEPRLRIYITTEQIELCGRKLLLVPWLQTKEEKEHFLKRLTSEKPEVCLGHLSVNGFEIIRNRCETNGFSSDVLSQNAKITFSGHFHLRNTKDNITYVGSPYETTWTDYGNVKGVYILNLRNLQVTFFPNELSPRHVKVFVSRANKLTDEELGKTVSKNFVKILVDTPVSEKVLSDLVTRVACQKPITSEVVWTEQNIVSGSTVTADMKSPMEFLREYIGSVSLPEGIEKELLTKYVMRLHEDALAGEKS